MEDVLDGLAKDENVVDKLDAALDVFDEAFGDLVEMVPRTNVSLWSSQEFVTALLVYHEGGVDLVVFVQGALVVAFPHVNHDEDGGLWRDGLGELFWTLKRVRITFQIFILKSVIQD